MERKAYVGFVLPSVVVMTVLMVVPFVTTVWLSLTDLNLRDLDSAPFIGFDNYTEIFGDDRFRSALKFTLIFVAFIVPAQLVMGLGVALLLDRVSRGRGIYIAIFLLPFVATPVVGTLAFENLFSRGGLLAYVIEKITGEQFVISAGNVNYLILVQALWYTMPFVMITLFAGLQTLPQERLEAAQVDGARFWRTLWHVTLPHLRKLIIFIVIIAIMDAYRVFDSVYVFAGNRFTESHTLAVYNYSVALDSKIGRLGKGNAVAILMVLGIFIVLLPFLVKSYKEQVAERR